MFFLVSLLHKFLNIETILPMNLHSLQSNILGYYIAAAYLILGSMRAIVLERERRSAWVRELVSRA